MYGQLILLISTMISADPDAAEVRVEQFDLEKAQASYVVSLPSDYDKSKRWPLILDFHGAISPTLKGANLTRDRLWSKFAKQSSYIVVGLNGRTRAWGATKGDKDDIAYALHVLQQVKKEYSIDEKRILLGGFSSGSDFLCKAGLQLKGEFAGSLVVCPGPPFVVGLRNGELLKAKDGPFFFMTGEEDYVRKDGAWQAFVALDKVGAKAMYREVPRIGHSFPEISEYARAVDYLNSLAHPDRLPEGLKIAREAVSREDFLLASTHLSSAKSDEAMAELKKIEQRGEALVKSAAEIDSAKEPGRAYEVWWRIRTQFYRFPKLAERAQSELDKLEKDIPRRDLYRHRRDWFRSRGAPKPKDENADSKPPARTISRTAREAAWHVDHYFNFDEAAQFMRDLAKRFPGRARLVTMGKSLEGRELLALEITDFSTGDPSTKPAVYAQGAIHGNEISSMMTVLYMAEQLVANSQQSRATGKLMRTTTFYAAPAVNPDAVHHYMTEPHSHWRPRYNSRPFDDDGDGRLDEDPYEDLNGDGEIGLMYQPDKEGDFVLKDGRVMRGPGKPRYKLIAREGIDNDDDGKFSEDRPGGVDLNRNFPVGFRSRKSFGGTSGTQAASEPETKAIIDFVSARPNINLFLDYHNAANCVFYWTDGRHDADNSFFKETATSAESMLGYTRKPLRHTGAGLAIAWAYGKLGVPSFLVELEAGRSDPTEYYATAWNDDAWIPVKKFKHPQLGEVLIGNDVKKIPKRNPHPKDIPWQVDRNWRWVKQLLAQLPKLELRQPKIKSTESGFVVTGEVANVGAMPTDTELTKVLKRANPVTLAVEGAALSGRTELDSLASGQSMPFQVEIRDPTDSVTLVIRHPRAGTVRLPVLRPKSASTPIRKHYKIEDGYATPDRAKLADNEFYKAGVNGQERGPAFELKHRKSELRLAVLLGQWRDQRHTIDVADFEQAFFSRQSYTSVSPTGQRVYGSLRDFYEEMSYGKMSVTGKVFDWIELPGRWAEYRDASFGSRMLSDRLIAGVRERYGANVLNDFDGLAVIWAGNAVRRTSALWPMRLSAKVVPGKAAFKMSEFHLGEMAAIGVACHEMGHTFGVNDKYGLGATANPMGPWCLMAKGTHGGKPSGRHRPFHLCAWCKQVIGWGEPAVIDPSSPQKLALRPISFGSRESFRILLKPDGSEYLLLENRRREGFHSDLPSPGLAVLRVGPNDRPASPQTRVQLLPAHGLPPLSRGIVAKPGQIAWPQKGRTKLVTDGVELSHIRLVDDVVYFEVGPSKQ